MRRQPSRVRERQRCRERHRNQGRRRPSVGPAAHHSVGSIHDRRAVSHDHREPAGCPDLHRAAGHFQRREPDRFLGTVRRYRPGSRYLRHHHGRWYGDAGRAQMPKHRRIQGRHQRETRQRVHRLRSQRNRQDHDQDEDHPVFLGPVLFHDTLGQGHHRVRLRGSGIRRSWESSRLGSTRARRLPLFG